MVIDLEDALGNLKCTVYKAFNEVKYIFLGFNVSINIYFLAPIVREENGKQFYQDLDIIEKHCQRK